MNEEAYMTVANKRISAANGIDYTYRDLADGTVPLVLLQHYSREPRQLGSRAY